LPGEIDLASLAPPASEHESDGCRPRLLILPKGTMNPAF
jgi:hypothetical protein